jgi:hypothetical protein
MDFVFTSHLSYLSVVICQKFENNFNVKADNHWGVPGKRNDGQGGQDGQGAPTESNG